jgi:hypothetical protein
MDKKKLLVYQYCTVIILLKILLCEIKFALYFRWFYTSDAQVTDTTIHEVMQANAYILFYTKFTSAVPPTCLV